MNFAIEVSAGVIGVIKMVFTRRLISVSGPVREDAKEQGAGVLEPFNL